MRKHWAWLLAGTLASGGLIFAGCDRNGNGTSGNGGNTRGTDNTAGGSAGRSTSGGSSGSGMSGGSSPESSVNVAV